MHSSVLGKAFLNMTSKVQATKIKTKNWISLKFKILVLQKIPWRKWKENPPYGRKKSSHISNRGAVCRLYKKLFLFKNNWRKKMYACMHKWITNGSQMDHKWIILYSRKNCIGEMTIKIFLKKE